MNVNDSASNKPNSGYNGKNNNNNNGGHGNHGGNVPRDRIFEPTPVNDNSVSTTCNRSGAYDLEWQSGGNGRGMGLVNSYSMGGGTESFSAHADSMFERFELEDPSYMDGGSGGAMVATSGGVAAHIQDVRPKSVLKNGLKAIKTGIKSSTNWIPNMISRATTNKNGKSKSKSKNEITINENLSSSSGYYSSVFSSENSNYATTSFSKEGNTASMTSNVNNASVNGGCATMIEPVVNYQQQRLQHQQPQQQHDQKPKRLPAHLSQTTNMVIQPQSMALATDHYAFMAPPRTPRLASATSIPTSIVGSNTPRQATSTSVTGNNVNTHVVKVEVHDTGVTAPSPLDSMSNLILPDDMVQYLNENKTTTTGGNNGNTNSVTGRPVDNVKEVPVGSPMVMSPPQHAPSINIASPLDGSINSAPPSVPPPPAVAAATVSTIVGSISEQGTNDNTTSSATINHQTMKWSDTNNNTMPATSSATPGYNQTASFYQTNGNANGTTTVGANYIDNSSINYCSTNGANQNGGNANWHTFPNGKFQDIFLQNKHSLTFFVVFRKFKLFDGSWLQYIKPSD